jgi:hypothetical protein
VTSPRSIQIAIKRGSLTTRVLDFCRQVGTRRIATVDADGVALAAIQALYKLSLEKDRRIAELERRLDGLQRRLEEKR